MEVNSTPQHPFITDPHYIPLPHNEDVIRVLQYQQICKICTLDTLHFEFAQIKILKSWPFSSRYDAISDTWGLDPARPPIVVDGKQVLILHSAETALRGLRECINPRCYTTLLPIWIDAVCINQTDLIEKQHQIQLMGRIYSRASTVYVWLGTADGARDPGMQAMEVLARQHVPGSVLQKKSTDETRNKLPLPATVSLPNLFAFFACAWLTRLWTVQEVVRGHHVIFVCGKRHLTWSAFDKAVDWLHFMLANASEELKVAIRSAMIVSSSKTQYRRLMTSNGFGIDRLLILALHYETTNSWDRIYALIGMLDSFAAPIIPDYSRPLADVYREATSQALLRPDFPLGSDLLSLTQALGPVPDDKLDEWPSWVPQYHEIGSRMLTIQPRSHRASNNCRPYYQFVHPAIMVVRGVQVSTIKVVYSSLADCLSAFWTNKSGSQPGIFDSLVHSLTAYHRMRGSVNSLSDVRTILRSHKGATDNPGLEALVNGLGGGRESSEDAQITIDATSECLHTLVELQDGSYAIAFNMAQPGDQICILLGMSEPMVLRRFGDKYKLRGVAFMPRIMLGEHIKMLEEQGRIEAETMDFSIS